MKIKKLGIIVVILVALLVLCVTVSYIVHRDIKVGRFISAEFSDTATFLSPIINSTKVATKLKVTGLIVPHHLLAVDMMADAFKMISGNSYDEVVVISPDHYFLGSKPVTVSSAGFGTVFGDLRVSEKMFSGLSKVSGISTDDSFFYREHGLGAEMPFVKYFFPNAKIIAITIKENAQKNDLDLLVDALEKVIDKNTLIEQCTDFSHYLNQKSAEQKDAESLDVLEKAIPDDVFSLKQPDNIDSVASLYVQMRLQNDFFHSKINVIDHRNSQAYTKDVVDSTTSYFTAMYTK